MDAGRWAVADWLAGQMDRHYCDITNKRIDINLSDLYFFCYRYLFTVDHEGGEAAGEQYYFITAARLVHSAGLKGSSVIGVQYLIVISIELLTKATGSWSI